MRNTTVFPAYYFDSRTGRLCKVTTWWLEAHAAHAFEALRNAYQAASGKKFVISSAGRTHAQQVALKRLKPTLAATPGKSYHEAGLAIDIDYRRMIRDHFGTQAALEAFMRQYSYFRTVKREAWHFEFIPAYPSKMPVKAAIAYIDNGA